MRDQMNEATTGMSLCIPVAATKNNRGASSSSSSSSPSSSTSFQQCTSSMSVTTSRPLQLPTTSILSAANIIEPNQKHRHSASPSSSSPLFDMKSASTTTPMHPTNNSNLIINIKSKYLNRILDNIEKISVLFGVQYMSVNNCNNSHDQRNASSLVIASDDERGYRSLLFQCASTATAVADNDIADLCTSLQNYIDSLSITEAEDSSYDSECDTDDWHEQVSRTTSDTLGQEYADYISQPPCKQTQQPQQQLQPDAKAPSYTQRVEFALKLGYTERLVQAALARLGPNPAQNELLAELIKLGAQHCNKGDLCDATSDCSLLNGQDNGCGTKDDSEYSRPAALLRPIVIDGSNVAMSHGNKEVFSCYGIRLCVDWFKNRGHKDITVFVPKYRKESCRPENPIKDQEILHELEKERLLVFTPSRLVGGKRTVCYDDRYILKLASENDGIVVSNDNYRDLVAESAEYKRVIEERVLMYSFVNDRFMPPDDPLGRSGPTLDNFLRIQPKKGDSLLSCPYGKKCTYGNKCKFYHPERGGGPQKSVTERLSEHAARHLSARNSECNTKITLNGKSLSVPLSSSNREVGGNADRRKPLARTRSCAHDGCDLNHCSETVNPARLNNSVKSNIPTWEEYCLQTTGDIQTFPKAHSKENISQEHQLPNISSHQHLYGGGQSLPPSQCRPAMQHFGHVNANLMQQQQQAPQSSQQPQQQQQQPSEEVNLHQKLRRQLSLNPTGCDPRIYRNQHANMNPPKLPNAVGSHRPLAPTLSGGPPRTHLSNQWNLHQNVTRIASAPDSTRAWQNNPPPSSSSEPHLWLQHSPVATTVGTATAVAASSVPLVSNVTQDHRRHLQYHLSSIFPEDQVRHVMQMYPDETNPQNICAAILNMFPKI